MASETYSSSLSKSSLIFTDSSNSFEKNTHKKTSPSSLSKRSSYSVESTVISSFLETSEFSSINTNNQYVNKDFNDKNRRLNFNSKDLKKKIYKCILDENTDYLKSFSSNSQIEDVKDKHKNNLMHIACGLGRINSAKVLIKYFPKLLEQVNDKQQRPIDVAIKHNQSKIVEYLIQKSNFKTDFTDVKKRPFVHIAAKNGSNEVLRLLLYEMNKRQLCLDLKDSFDNTSSHLAAKYGHLDCLQSLVEYNCDITLTNKDGHTPCFVAELNSHSECVNYLTIVETCITMSLELVKLNRILRECKSENEVLKIQMEETIGINNDFINQRENSVNISLELMQKQIDNLESKLLNEINRLKSENEDLKERLNDSNAKELEEINYKREVEMCKKELFCTHKNSLSFLAIDYKRIDNLKNRFEEIKLKKSHCNKHELEQDINNEHIDLLRKIHQETTHKLMIFRNALKNYAPSSSNYSNQITNSTSTMTSSNYETKSYSTSSVSSQFNSLFKPVRCQTINFDLENE